MTAPLRSYAAQSPVTDPGRLAPLLDDLPEGVEALAAVVRGLLFHYREGELYGHEVPRERVRTDEARRVEAMLEKIVALDPRPLAEARPPGRRLVGCCRDYAVLLTAMLRHRGTPARARFGFALYISEHSSNDHVVAEHFSARLGRWALADAQQDELHVSLNRLDFDPHDIPRDRFLVAGEAWWRARAAEADWARFGYGPGELSGAWVVQHYLALDLASLSKREMLIGDQWGLGAVGPGEGARGAELTLLDQAAALSLGPDSGLAELRALVEGEPNLRVPPTVRCWPLARELDETVPVREADPVPG